MEPTLSRDPIPLSPGFASSPETIHTSTSIHDSVNGQPMSHRDVDQSRNNRRIDPRRPGSSIRKRPRSLYRPGGMMSRCNSTASLPSPIACDGDNRPISKLLGSLIEVWSGLLNQETWALSFGPRLLTPSTPSDHSTPEELNPTLPDYQQKCWELARCQLGDERDRFYLWKSTFDDHDLDELLKTGLSLCNILGMSILKAFFRIADSLYAAIDTSRSPESAQRLNQALQEAREILSLSQDDSICGADITTVVTGDMDADGQQNLLHNLRHEISRLSRLRFQISLALSEVENDVGFQSPPELKC
ncbi:hypothetical protein F5883DRAFT_29619 [Diaporthe sp. PMI_573]|nr:hypothetical protein F5883DRAFT_29619 [Diaporthaceae sp. PMI_573]